LTKKLIHVRIYLLTKLKKSNIEDTKNFEGFFMSFWKKEKSHILRPFLVLYIGAILIPTLICTLVYFGARKDTAKYSEREIFYVKKSIDELLDRADKISQIYTNFEDRQQSTSFIKGERDKGYYNIFVLSPIQSAILNDLTKDEDKTLYNFLIENFLNYKDSNLYPYKGNKAIYFKTISPHEGLAFIIDFESLILNKNIVLIKTNNGNIYQKGEGIDEKAPKSGYITHEGPTYTIVINRLNKNYYATSLYIFGMFITLIFALFSIRYILSKYFSPIIEITKKLSGKHKIAGISNINEAISNFDRQIKTNQNIQKNSFLLRALNGKLDSDFFCGLKNFDIHFTSEDFCVVLIKIEEYSNLFFEQEKTSESQLEIVQFIITNVMSELFGERFTLTYAESNDMIIYILNIGENTPDLANILEGIAAKGKNFIEKEFGLLISIAISQSHPGYEGLLTAYKEVLSIYEKGHVLGQKGYVETFSQTNVKNVISGYNTSYEEQQFANCLKVGDYEKARRILNEIFENHFLQSVQTIQMIKSRMIGLINTMINVIGGMNIDNKDAFMEEINLVERLFKCETVIELQNEMNALICELEVYVRDKVQNNSNKIKDEITKYIQENYKNHDLSVAKIADEFNMNASYLSKFFKKHVGEGLLNYIHTIRIEKSKKLLEDDNLSIKEIADMVGFYNSDAYIRTFKKIIGITPGKYRGINKKS